MLWLLVLLRSSVFVGPQYNSATRSAITTTLKLLHCLYAGNGFALTKCPAVNRVDEWKCPIYGNAEGPSCVMAHCGWVAFCTWTDPDNLLDN